MTKQKIIENCYFRLPKDTSLHKDWSHATGHQVDNLLSKIKNLRKFSNSYSKEQTEHFNCHSFEFLHKNCQTQYTQRHIQSRIKDLRCSFWQQQLTFLEAYSERSWKSKIKLFEKIVFSGPLFQPFTIYTKTSISDVPLCSEFTSGTINYFCNRLHFDVWLGSRYTSDMF